MDGKILIRVDWCLQYFFTYCSPGLKLSRKREKTLVRSLLLALHETSLIHFLAYMGKYKTGNINIIVLFCNDFFNFFISPISSWSSAATIPSHRHYKIWFSCAVITLLLKIVCKKICKKNGKAMWKLWKHATLKK